MSAEPLELLLREFRLTPMAARCGEMLASAEAQNWGHALYFTPTFKLVQQLLAAKRTCAWRRRSRSWTASKP